MSYILSVDQSTQVTKALLFDSDGRLICRRDVAHEQIIDHRGWVSHDPEEIWRNTVESVRRVIEAAGVDAGEIAALGISNQRETSVCWDKTTGKPIANAIVWQCGRAKELCRRVADAGWSERVRKDTGIPISPYFPASKFAWLVESTPGAREMAARHQLYFGTIDTWLVYCLTGGREYQTDYSNASRTQLFNLRTLAWDAEICNAFGLDEDALAQVTDSDGCFGYADIGGILPPEIPIHGVLGDSHTALFGQGCLKPGMAKATYGTSSFIMMNIGSQPIESRNGLVTSLAWKARGQVSFVMESNLNYTGAVIRWLEEDLGLIASAAEIRALAQSANPDDTTYLVPAFTGLGAPYWDDDAKALICGITRPTGRAELVKAGLDCIAYQITDIVRAMERDTGGRLSQLRADGGPTANGYLMQLQSDLLDAEVLIPCREELHGIGAAWLAGLSCGAYGDAVFEAMQSRAYAPRMAGDVRENKYSGWQRAVRLTTTHNELELQGIVQTSSRFHWKGVPGAREIEGSYESEIPDVPLEGDFALPYRWTGTDWMAQVIDDYEKDYPNLVRHADGYPAPDYLRSITKVGNIGYRGEIEAPTEGSELIRKAILDDDPRTLYLQVWGGSNTIARALMDIEAEFKDSPQWPSMHGKITEKIVITACGEQDETYRSYIAERWPGNQYVKTLQIGSYAYPWYSMPEGESKDTLRAEFMKREILNGNSALADGYCTWLDGKYYEGEDAQGQFGTNPQIAQRWAATGRGEPKRYDFISEGDSPTFFPLFDWGFRTLEDFSYGGIAGRYHRVPGKVNAKGEPLNLWNASKDVYTDRNGQPHLTESMWRYVADIQRDFAARVAWAAADCNEKGSTRPLCGSRKGWI